MSNTLGQNGDEALLSSGGKYREASWRRAARWGQPACPSSDGAVWDGVAGSFGRQRVIAAVWGGNGVARSNTVQLDEVGLETRFGRPETSVLLFAKVYGKNLLPVDGGELVGWE